MSRSERKYGLPRLTFKEAARVLGVEEAAFELFIMKTIRPGSDRWSKWSTGALPLPEVVIRLYLDWLRQLQPEPMHHSLPAAMAVPPAKEPPKGRDQRRASGK